MARSPSHKLGQIIGGQLEAAIRLPLAVVAEEFNLYLDYQHPRTARGGKSRVAWKDGQGNTHILDYVLEEGGSEIVQGRPRAFVEIAWRRYKKHSKNKAQEIQGAITPLAETYQDSHPFLGAVLAGEFTEPSLEQFQSHRFNLIYCPYTTILQAFASEGVDVSSEEDTRDEVLQEKVDSFGNLSAMQHERIAEQIRTLNSDQFQRFFESFRRSLGRRVEYVVVLPLQGNEYRCDTIQAAVEYISNFDQSTPSSKFVKYELNIRYSNGDDIRGTFHDKDRAIEFLSLYST